MKFSTLPWWLDWYPWATIMWIDCRLHILRGPGIDWQRTAASIYWTILGVRYARVAEIAYFRIGRLTVYRRVGELRSFRPTLEPATKGAN